MALSIFFCSRRALPMLLAHRHSPAYRQSLTKRGGGLVVFVLTGQDDAEIVMSLGIVGVDLDCFPVRKNGVVQPALSKNRAAEQTPQFGVARLGRQEGAVNALGFGETAGSVMFPTLGQVLCSVGHQDLE